jgi:hypothetical protein
MNSNFVFRVLSAALLACLALLALAQQRGDEILRGFVSTRGIEDKRGTEVVTSRKNLKPKPKPRPASAIGLGYTLFKKGANGEAVRVNPSQEFRSGDKLRFVIESNTAGYLYIFHQENDAPPKLIYPDPRLKRGGNRIEAHAQHETPSNEEPGDWWFNFVGPAATERFYLVVARKPLMSVRSGDSLVTFCQQNPKGCPWRPAEAAWKQLLAQANTATKESRSQTFGEAQTEVERLAIKRDVKLQPDDPAPSVIKVSASPSARMLMATVEIVHKE